MKHPSTAPPNLSRAEPAAPLPAPRARQRLRLLSYNIQAGVATQRYRHYLTQGWKHVLPHRRLQENLNRIARLISDYQLVALQEVDAGSLRTSFINQTEYLALQAGFPFWYSQTNRKLGQFAQVSIGVLSRIRPGEIFEHRLPSRIPGRGTMMVRLGPKPHSLVLFIVHLALGRRARMRQIEFIGNLVNEHKHVVVMGDFNFQSGSPEMKLLLNNTPLTEPIQQFPTFPSWRPLRNIDHILVSSELVVEKVEVLHHPLSDHLPIAMELSLPPDVVLDI